MKNQKKILSLILAVSMILSMFSGLGIVTSAADSAEVTYTQYEAETYGYANRYSMPFEKCDGSGGYSVGGYSANGAESYEQLADGIDNSKTPYVAYTVNAPAAGEYSIKVRMLLSEYAEGDVRYVGIVVKGSSGTIKTYKTTNATNQWYNWFSATIELEEGKNTIYSVSYVDLNGSWHRQDALEIDSRIKVYRASMKATETDKFALYNNNGDSFGGGWGGSKSLAAGITVENKDNVTRSLVEANSQYYTAKYLAPEAGTYEVLLKYTCDTKGAPEAAAIFVGEDNQSKNLTKEYGNVARFTLDLEEGLNDILITGLLPANDATEIGWSDHYSISILGAEVSGRGAALKLEAEHAEIYNLYNVGQWTLDSADTGYSPVISFADGISKEQLEKIPYYSYTVNVPATGKYLIEPKAQKWDESAPTYYLALVVDGETTYTSLINNTSTDDYKHFGAFSVELTAGIHTVTVTAAFKTDNAKADWVNQLEIYFHGGITKAAVQLNPIDNLARMEAKNYGNAIRYEVQSNKLYSGGDCYGNYYAPSQQSYDSLTEYFDASNTGAVSYIVDAPADGDYYIAPGYCVGKVATEEEQFMAVTVNDGQAYKVNFEAGKTMAGATWNKAGVNVTLKAGRNVIRLIPYVNVGGTWHNQDYLAIDPRLTAVKTEKASLNAANADYVSRYTRNNGYLGGAENDYLATTGITAETVSYDKLYNIPYFSYTVNAPKAGYYDMQLAYTTDAAAPSGYIAAIVNGVTTAEKFNVYLNSNTLASNKVNVSAYLNEGDNVLVFTVRMPENADDTEGKYTWMDLGDLTLTGGLTKAAAQQDVAAKKTFAEAEEYYANRINYSPEEDKWKTKSNAASGKYFVGYADPIETLATFDELSLALPQNDISYIAYAVNAPETKEYTFTVRYALGYEGNSAEEGSAWASYIADNTPYAVVMANGTAQKAYYTHTVPGKLCESTEVTFTLNEGVNIIYTAAITGEIKTALEGAYINHDCLVLPAELTVNDTVDMYIPGDANDDGELNILDLIRIKKALANLTAASTKADFDGADGVANADMAILAKLLVNPTDEAVRGYSFLKTVANPDIASDIGVSTSEIMSAESATAFLTVAGTDTKFKQTALSDGSATADYTFNIDAENYETIGNGIEGFGASITESSAKNLLSMSASYRNRLMKDLFSADNGIGLSFLRQPFGSADFAESYYTYADTKGEAGNELANFSIQRDIDNGVIPLIKQALGLNNNIKLIGNVWSPPTWMKTVDDFRTNEMRFDSWENGYPNAIRDADGNINTLNPAYYDTYAEYLIKSVKAFEAELGEGIFHSISTGNEPNACVNYPSTYYTSEQKVNLLNAIGPKIDAAGINLITWDQGYDLTDENYLAAITNPDNGVDGIAFHPYTGTADNMAEVAAVAAGLPVYVTEAAGNNKGTAKDQLMRNVKGIADALNNGASSYIMWNVCLNQDGGPLYNGAVVNDVGGTGLALYNTSTGKTTYNPDFYALAHYSKFISEGNYAVVTDDYSAQGIISTVTTVNGLSFTAVIANQNDTAKTITVNINAGDNTVPYQYTIPAGGVVTLVNLV